jgi:flagellar basal-body rod modification protein FlgD
VTGAFHLDAPAAGAEVEIYDENGSLVRTLTLGPQAAGNRSFTWDGRMDDGTSAPSGRYRVAVTARNADGASVNADLTIEDTVDAVGYDGGYPILDVGGVSVMMGDVRRIGEAR